MNAALDLRGVNRSYLVKPSSGWLHSYNIRRALLESRFWCYVTADIAISALATPGKRWLLALVSFVVIYLSFLVPLVATQISLSRGNAAVHQAGLRVALSVERHAIFLKTFLQD